MQASRCFFNSATALRKVFVSNAAALEAPGQLQRLLLPALSAPRATQRPFSTHPVSHVRWGRKQPPAATEEKTTRMRDYGIVFPWIQLRQEDGSLTEPQRTTAVLKKMNLERETLLLLAAPKTEEASKGPQYPICRIADRRAEAAALAEAAKKKPPKVASKELELNWATAPNDMRTKLAQLKKFLLKGYQVEVRLLHPKKKGKKRATNEEAQLVLEAVRQAIAEVPGAKEARRMDGKVGETVTLLLQAPAQKAGAPAEPASPGSPEGAEAGNPSVSAG